MCVVFPCFVLFCLEVNFANILLSTLLPGHLNNLIAHITSLSGIGPGGASHPTEGGLRQCMFICSLIAVLGALVTYVVIPTYGAENLDGDGYLPLDFQCLQPKDEQYGLLEGRKAGYEMVEVVDCSVDDLVALTVQHADDYDSKPE